MVVGYLISMQPYVKLHLHEDDHSYDHKDNCCSNFLFTKIDRVKGNGLSLTGYVLTIVLLLGVGLAVSFSALAAVFEAMALTLQPYSLPASEEQHNQMFECNEDDTNCVDTHFIDHCANSDDNNAVRRSNQLHIQVLFSILSCVSIVFMLACIRYDHLLNRKMEEVKKVEVSNPLLGGPKTGENKFFAKLDL